MSGLFSYVKNTSLSKKSNEQTDFYWLHVKLLAICNYPLCSAIVCICPTRGYCRNLIVIRTKQSIEEVWPIFSEICLHGSVEWILLHTSEKKVEKNFEKWRTYIRHKNSKWLFVFNCPTLLYFLLGWNRNTTNKSCPQWCSHGIFHVVFSLISYYIEDVQTCKICMKTTFDGFQINI